MTIHNRAGRYTKAAETFEEMAAWGVKPDRVAYTVMITAYARLGDKFSARRVKEEFCQQGMQPDVGLMNALMHAHGKVKPPSLDPSQQAPCRGAPQCKT